MNKRDFNLLGKVFESEISGQPLFQSKSKRFLALEEQGLVSFSEQQIKFNDGLPPMTIKGWVLTPQGHFAYCSACEKYCQEDV